MSLSGCAQCPRFRKADDNRFRAYYWRPTMFLMRALLMRRRALAVLVVVAALCMKIVVPTGVMVAQDSRVLTVQICNDALGDQAVTRFVVPMKDGGGESGGKQGKGDCPFASASPVSMTGAGPALLALALAFILALGFAPAAIALPKRVFHLRPPLRGPPALV